MFSAFGAKTLKLDPQLRANYVILLEQADDFHKAIAQQDETAIVSEIKETQEIIAKLYSQILSITQFQHKIHSHKLLNSIEVSLSSLNNSLDENKKKQNLKKLFNSFFELAQVYDLTKDISSKILYCPRDKSLWFQKQGKAQNPINPSYKNCGRAIL